MKLLVPLNTDPQVIRHGDHGSGTYRKLASMAKKSHGRIIEVGAPITPAKNWNCGTDMVWPVLDEKILRETGRIHLKGKIFVCRHQIIVGD